jgi:hypothetical protein
MFRIGLPLARLSHPQFEDCPHCHGHLSRIESFLDIRSDKPVRIFRCGDCQRITFDD